MALLLYSFIIGGTGAWLTLKFSPVFGINDVPNERSSHTKITPKGGGVGLCAAYLVSAYILNLPFFIWSPGMVVSLVSLWGDRREIRPLIRLAVQFLCGLVLLAGLFISRHSDLAAFLAVIPLAVYIVGTANFYNFMDGIDGIAGLSGVVAFGLLGFAGGSDDLCLLSWSMAFACIGFLPFNFPKAKIFMGDVGSILLGFLFASIVVMNAETMTDFLIMSGFLFPFYFDELLSMFLRVRKRMSLMVPHRSHVYQLLANEIGIAHWKVSMGYGLVQLLFGILLLVIREQGGIYILMAYLCCAGLLVVFSWFIHRISTSVV